MIWSADMTRAEHQPVRLGFTLLELMVVLVIMSLMALSIPSFGRLEDHLQAQSLTREITLDLKNLREEAIRQRVTTSLVWDMPDNRYILEPSGIERKLPVGLSANFETIEPTLTGEEAGLNFYPDGSSSGGLLVVTHGKYKTSIHIAWLDGGVSTDGG